MMSIGIHQTGYVLDNQLTRHILYLFYLQGQTPGLSTTWIDLELATQEHSLTRNNNVTFHIEDHVRALISMRQDCPAKSWKSWTKACLVPPTRTVWSILTAILVVYVCTLCTEYELQYHSNLNL